MKLRLRIWVLAAITTLGVQADDLLIVEVDWENFRHYVAGHAWIADIDFREEEVQSLHVCAGFNAFNHYSSDPGQMSRYGFEDASKPNRELQAAAFAITMNAHTVKDKAISYIQELRESEEYKNKTGDGRLAYARDFLWRHISSDPEVEAAVRTTVRELHEAAAKLVDAGLISAGVPPDDPFKYMLGMNLILMNPETVDAIIADEGFQTLRGTEARRRFFEEELSGRLTTATGIEDEQQRAGYRDSVRENIDELFNVRGSYALSLSR